MTHTPIKQLLPNRYGGISKNHKRESLNFNTRDALVQVGEEGPRNLPNRRVLYSSGLQV